MSLLVPNKHQSSITNLSKIDNNLLHLSGLKKVKRRHSQKRMTVDNVITPKESANIEQWNEIRVSNTLPSRRAHHSSLVVGELLYVYGGVDTRQGMCSADYLWAVNPLGQFLKWECLKIEDKPRILPGILMKQIFLKIIRQVNFGEPYSPSRRRRQSSNKNFKRLNPLCFQINLKTLRSQNFQVAVLQPSSGQKLNDKMAHFDLTCIDSHTAVFYKPENIIITFGGYYNNAFINNFLSLIHVQSKKWIIANDLINSPFPLARCDHAAVLLGDKMYLMGGKNIELNMQFNDLWLFDIPNYKWQQVLTPFNNSLPPPRSGHAITADEESGKIYIFGGSSLTQTQELNDFYSFDTKKEVWELLHASHYPEDVSQSLLNFPGNALKRLTRKLTNQLSFIKNQQPLTPLHQAQKKRQEYMKMKQMHSNVNSFLDDSTVQSKHGSILNAINFTKPSFAFTPFNFNKNVVSPTATGSYILDSEKDVSVSRLPIPKFDNQTQEEIKENVKNQCEQNSQQDQQNEILDLTYSPGEALFRQQQNLIRITKLRKKNLKNQINYESKTSEAYKKYKELRDSQMPFRQTNDYQFLQSKKRFSMDDQNSQLNLSSQILAQSKPLFEEMNVRIQDQEGYPVIYHKRAFNIQYTNFINTYFKSQKDRNEYLEQVKSQNIEQEINQFDSEGEQREKDRDRDQFQKSMLPEIPQILVDHINKVDTLRYFQRKKYLKDNIGKSRQKYVGNQANTSFKVNKNSKDNLVQDNSNQLQSQKYLQQSKTNINSPTSSNLSPAKRQQIWSPKTEVNSPQGSPSKSKKEQGFSQLLEASTNKAINNFLRFDQLDRMTPTSRQLKESMIGNLQQYCDLKAITKEQQQIKHQQHQSKSSHKMFSPREGIVSGKFPTQRDGMTINLMCEYSDEIGGKNQKSIILFGGDRFRMTYNDLYCFNL
ncbi:kelch motif family protein [Stylonychia lemnae]|uniref:Kelch motif family protein n=1 Tax=Stylonychia lemnae TaxID=5949 RepID=A0A077ZXB8_STYLE|nr:kelch motif family protein [Stylonychia lemnae]|eukprot:CDW74556.1 kelch motif family protein [Stylonychia lemnae]